MRACWGYGLHKPLWKVKGTVLGKPAREGESPLGENGRQRTGMNVLTCFSGEALLYITGFTSDLRLKSLLVLDG